MHAEPRKYPRYFWPFRVAMGIGTSSKKDRAFRKAAIRSRYHNLRRVESKYPALLDTVACRGGKATNAEIAGRFNVKTQVVQSARGMLRILSTNLRCSRESAAQFVRGIR